MSLTQAQSQSNTRSFWSGFISSVYSAAYFDARFTGVMNCTLELALPKDDSIQTSGHAACNRALALLCRVNIGSSMSLCLANSSDRCFPRPLCPR